MGFLYVPKVSPEWVSLSKHGNHGGRILLTKGIVFFRVMENSGEAPNGIVPRDNGHISKRFTSYQPNIKALLSWLDLRVFYVRVSKCEIDDSTPEFLTVNHIPLYPDTLLEVNGVTIGISSGEASTLLRRDRLDKKSEEATFVSTDIIRMAGSVKFDVFDKEIIILSGVLELCNSNGFVGESRSCSQKWSMNCESDLTVGTGFLKTKQFMGSDLTSPTIEVYVAGSFSGSPIVLTKTLQLCPCKRHMQMAMLDSIPECDAVENQNNAHSSFPLQLSEYSNHKPETDDYNHIYSGAEYIEGEEGELSWFNAGVRVGVGIGLSICLGIGIGVGLLVKTYQGTTRNFRRRLL